MNANAGFRLVVKGKGSQQLMSLGYTYRLSRDKNTYRTDWFR
jgi:hypothetical protein